MNESCFNENAMNRNRELGNYGHYLRKEEEDDLIFLSINISGLQAEIWKVKIDIVRDFVFNQKPKLQAYKK